MEKSKAVYFGWMLESVGKILAYSKWMDLRKFEKDSLVQDACLMQFQHLGETANKLKSNFPDEIPFPTGRWSDSEIS